MPEWITTIKQHPSGVLLAAQLIAVLAYPFTGETAAGRAVLGVFGIFVLGVAVWAVAASMPIINMRPAVSSMRKEKSRWPRKLRVFSTPHA